MAGRFAPGRKGWLLAGIPLLLALVLLALSYGAQQQTGGMTELEARLSATLSGIEGAGDVRVMILSEDTAPAFSTGTAHTQISGAIIVAGGAGDLGVRMELQHAVMTLFSLPAERVEVFSGKDGDLR